MVTFPINMILVNIAFSNHCASITCWKLGNTKTKNIQFIKQQCFQPMCYGFQTDGQWFIKLIIKVRLNNLKMSEAGIKCCDMQIGKLSVTIRDNCCNWQKQYKLMEIPVYILVLVTAGVVGDGLVVSGQHGSTRSKMDVRLPQILSYDGHVTSPLYPGIWKRWGTKEWQD